ACSMCRYSSLCAIISFYGTSFRSIGRHPNLWTVIHILCAVSIFSYSINLISDLCAFILFYGSLSCSMCRYSALCAFILFYGSLSCSMCLYLVLCALVQLYVPSHNSMDQPPRSMCQPNDDHSTNRHSVFIIRALLCPSTLISLSTQSIFL